MPEIAGALISWPDAGNRERSDLLA
jgi:hypothetical protein